MRELLEYLSRDDIKLLKHYPVMLTNITNSGLNIAVIPRDSISNYIKDLDNLFFSGAEIWDRNIKQNIDPLRIPISQWLKLNERRYFSIWYAIHNDNNYFIKTTDNIPDFVNVTDLTDNVSWNRLLRYVERR